MSCNQLLDLEKDEAILMKFRFHRLVFCSMECSINMFNGDDEE